MKRLAALAAIAVLAAASDSGRKEAVERGLRFIYRTACDAKNFGEYGEDYLWRLYHIGHTSRDPALARTALAMGRERAKVWRREHASLPPDALGRRTGNKLSGQIEADETFIGGKAWNMHISNVRALSPALAETQECRSGILEPGGKVRTKVVDKTKKKTLQGEVRKHVLASSAIFTNAAINC